MSSDIVWFEKRTVFRERSSGKAVSFVEQIMSKDKYTVSEHFQSQIEDFVFANLQVLWAISLGYFLVLAGGKSVT